MSSTSIIEISRAAHKSNIRYLRKVIGRHARFSSVLKGNAYGHGIENMVSLCEESGIDHFSVFSADEAARVYKASSKESDIMIMGSITNDELEWAIENDIEFFVFDRLRLERAIALASAMKKKARIHLEVETGFHRTGLEYVDLDSLMLFLKNNIDHFVFEGLCTHFAGAESLSNYLRIKNQLTQFRRFSRYFAKQNLIPKRNHTACSAAALTYPGTIMDMVRFGIAQFGYWPSPETQMFRFRKKPTEAKEALKRLLSWKTRVMAVKHVEPGNFIGYGSSFLANKKTKIAIIPVGYANGFSRALSNKGRVLIRGRRVPVIGTVTMNTTTVNISDLPNVEPGDEVVMIGKQKRMAISIASFCELSNDLNYQLLTRIPDNIPRHIVS